jgi:hypothetical protein
LDAPGSPGHAVQLPADDLMATIDKEVAQQTSDRQDTLTSDTYDEDPPT